MIQVAYVQHDSLHEFVVEEQIADHIDRLGI